MALSDARQRSLLALYDLPVAFWAPILGPELHFHLGHFAALDTPLEVAQREAVATLARAIPLERIDRVFDLGCGWGGPAFQLARLWGSEVVAVTISAVQARFVNDRAAELCLPVRAIKADLEAGSLPSVGKFDVIWLYEVLEHIGNRRRLLQEINVAAKDRAYLALSVACRAPHVDRAAFQRDETGALASLAIQPLDTQEELIDILDAAGWQPTFLLDCTERTLPTWSSKLERVREITNVAYREAADRLGGALIATSHYFMTGKLKAVQAVCHRKASC